MDKNANITEKITITGAIFDVDGTILDSMQEWRQIGSRFLVSKGCTPAPDIDEKMIHRTLEESALAFKEEYGVQGSIEEIVEGILKLIEDGYRHTIQLKEGILGVLDDLREMKIPMYVATATDRDMLEPAFARLDLWKYFNGMITCSELGVSKRNADIYRHAAGLLHSAPEKTLVFEDVEHAVTSASDAGFPVVAIYDKASEKENHLIRRKAAVYFNSFTEWPGLANLRI